MNKLAAVLAMTGCALTLQTVRASDITGTITLQGTPPKEKEITPLKEDANCGKFHAETPTTHFYVVGSKGELADVIVSLKGVPAQSTGASAPPVVLDQKGCEYSPSIFAVQTGQKIVVKNSDPVLHNIHDVPGSGSANEEKNVAQMAGGADLSFTFSHPEEFLKFKCDVHPWMFAWASIYDHPFFDVSAKDGTFTIKNVPPGKYTLQAAHRKAGTVTQEVEVKAGESPKVALTLQAK
jgi:plastocyanin